MSNKKSGIDLYNYYRKRIDSFLDQLAKTETDLSSKAIHDLRVDIKKIRSFFLLLEMLTSRKFMSKEHSNIFDELFKRAGKIRELHINILLFSKYISPSKDIDGFKKSLKPDIVNSIKEFKTSVNNFNVNDLNISEAGILKLCSAFSRDIILNKCRKFIAEEFKKISKIYYEGKPVSRFHKIRKHFRTLREVMDLLLLFETNKKIKNYRKQITLMEDNLGNWHDHMILFNSLNIFIKKDLTVQNKFTRLKKLMPEIKNDAFIFLDKQNFRLSSNN